MLPTLEEEKAQNQAALFLVQQIRSIGVEIERDQIEILRLKGEIEVLDSKKSLDEVCREVYKRAVDLVYQRSIGEIQETLNAAMKYIFYDEDYSAEFRIGNKKSKIIDFLLYDKSYDPPRIVDMRGGVGNGIRSVVSFVLQVHYILSQHRLPLILLDEAYYGISASYVDRFFNFVKALCKAKGFAFVLVTHDERFFAYADVKYNISKGMLKKVEEGG